MSEPGTADEASDTIGSPGTQQAKRRLDPGFKRNMLIIAGVVGVAVVLVLVILLRPSSARQGPAPRSEVMLGSGQTQATDNMTPEMTRKLEEKQREESRTAAKDGRTYIPPDPTGASSPVAMPQPAPSPGSSTLAAGSAPVTQYAAGLNAESDTRRREGLVRQLAGLVEDSSGGVRQRVVAESKEPAGRAAAPASGAVGQAGAQQARRVLVPGLAIAAAELTSDIKVPAGAQGFASAKISSGPAAGGFLIGTAKVVDESLEIAFTQMRLGDTVYRVDAIVLDETTAANAINGSVDRRLLQRYALPIAMAAAQGFFVAKAQTGSTVVSFANTVGGVATPPPNSDQAKAAGIAAGLQIGTQEVQRASQQPIVVSRERSYPVGILFRAPVTEESQ